MTAQMGAKAEASDITLRDLYLYEKLCAAPLAKYQRLLPVPDSMKDEFDETLRKVKEQGFAAFIHFSQRPAAEAQKIYERVRAQLLAFEAADINASALDYRSLFLFGVISKEARDTAARIHKANGLILTEDGKLKTYRRLTQMGAQPISERPSKTDIVSITAQIEKGQRTGTDEGFDLDEPSRTQLFPEGIEEILGLKNQYLEIDNDVKTGRKAREVAVDDTTLLELFQIVSDKFGGDARKINYFLSEGRERIAVLRQMSATVVQP